MSVTEPPVIAVPLIPPADDEKPKPIAKEDKPKADKPKADARIGPKGPGTTSTQSGKPGKFHRELAEFFCLPALVFELRKDYVPAYIWTVRSEPFAYSVADLAERNAALKRWLVRFMEGGAYGAVVMSGLALIVPIAAYYGLYPQTMMNPFALSPQEAADFEQMMQERETRGFSMPGFSWGGVETEDEGIPYALS